MQKGSDRVRQIGVQIQRELSQLLREGIRDPRLGMVTIPEVRVSPDLSHAKIFVTVMGDEVVRKQSMDVLERAAGFLRGELGRAMRLRVVPQLHFVYDQSLEAGNRLSSLIDSAVADDKSKSESE
jgi:ribosome-binding factor A